MIKSRIMPDGQWGGNYEQWQWENEPELNFTETLYTNQFDYVPKWDEINQEWYESLTTQLERNIFNTILELDQALLDTDRHVIRWIYERQPMPFKATLDRKRLYEKCIHDILEFDPTYVFPENYDESRVDLTYRFQAVVGSDTITVPRVIGHEFVSEVEINGFTIINPVYNPETGIINVSVDAGDLIKVTY